MTWSWESWSLEDEEVKPVLTLTMALRRAPMGVLLLRDASDGAMHVALTQGLNGDASALVLAHAQILTHVNLACDQHRRVSIRDVRAKVAKGVESIRELALTLGFRGMEVLPLERRNAATLGALTLFFPSPLRPSPRSERLVDMAAMLISLALDNARLRADELRRRRIAEQRAFDRLQFLSKINHELRTPLQSITGYIELLGHSNESLTPRQREILDHMEHSEQVLLSIIDGVANLGRLEAGRMIYRIASVTIVDVLARVMSIVAPLAQKQQVALSVDAPARDLLARGDHGKITQILINLLTNAIKFTPARGTVTLRTRRVGSRIDFIVKDEGPGIPADKLAAIFEPWVQFDQRRYSPLAGFGLGLTISRELAVGMGGTLEAQNATPPEGGAVFTFSIRVHRPDRPVWSTRSPAKTTSDTESQSLAAIPLTDSSDASTSPAADGSG